MGARCSPARSFPHRFSSPPLSPRFFFPGSFLTGLFLPGLFLLKCDSFPPGHFPPGLFYPGLLHLSFFSPTRFSPIHSFQIPFSSSQLLFLHIFPQCNFSPIVIYSNLFPPRSSNIKDLHPWFFCSLGFSPVFFSPMKCTVYSWTFNQKYSRLRIKRPPSKKEFQT